MGLHAYTRKRSFNRTPEPKGDAPQPARRRRPIFVVQLHHASTRHYDFRLEADGVLKSWAVPKGPSLRAGEKRLAVEVEDHPLEYATFEGDIPEGNYGAGHVDVFDHGHWRCEGDPLSELRRGTLDFTLSGSKLRGGWKLVRTRLRGKQPQWLLIKRHDKYAGSKEADDLARAKRRRAPATVKMTHPERVMFEGARFTKADVADYYRAVARWMLPELRDRPLSLVRCPDGSGGACFFNKHHSPSLGQHVRAIALMQKSGKEKYLYIDSLEGLLELVQMSTLELHPWGAKVDAPERPDRLVFDLDPGDGVAWKEVVAAARDTREKLAATGLESFVRLSGGKGLHVVAPIRPGPSWDDVKGFCQGFAAAMATQSPERYVATMSKSKRAGRIFIDWLRNTRGATSVASWSLRARKSAPVAVPLRWEDLAAIRSASAFDLTRAKQRAVRLRSDPWAKLATLGQTLPG